MSRNPCFPQTGCDRSQPRRAAALFFVLIALAVASMLMAVWATAAIDRHRQLRDRDQELQAAWLADSGLARATAQLATSQDYTGEEWNISAEQLQRRDSALVTIRVEPVSEQPQRRSITVIADFPIDPTLRKRKRLHTVFDLSRLGEQP